MTEKEKKVYEILLTPIICDNSVKKICMQDNIIYSPQLYNSNLDEDMSDFSVGFYEIVYKDILKENNRKILKENGKYINENYMGDTMHSFNSLANIILDNKSKINRSPKEMWPEELIDYHLKYHCLANFWIIPMCHGRKSAKLSWYDSLDYYLEEVKNYYLGEVESSFIESQGYFKNFTWESFLDTHGLSEYKMIDDPLKIYKEKDKKACLDEIERIYGFWENRSSQIVKNYNDELYNYFNGLGLINDGEIKN
ncbi:hypothetical protein ABGF48_06755 [Helcococcus bovis]|uniref:hypothetical protein n=1 Tax=Helcococcus bovis TaxID=3153252 RepID=UPI0038BACEE7